MLEYCEARGVGEAHAREAGFEALDPTETKKLAPNHAFGRCASRIPFRDLDGKPIGFERLRFQGDPVGFGRHTKKEPPRFWQEQDSDVAAYLAPSSCVGRPWREIAKDTSAEIVITEGEVKALAACLSGVTAIGVTGVDKFHVGGDKDLLVPLLDQIDWRGRTVFIVWDSDAATKPDVLRAECELRAALERRRASVHAVRLPPAKDGKKQGLDDLLVASGPDAFRRLQAAVDRLPAALDAGDVLFQKYDPVRFAIDPYFPKAELVEINGAHGLHKSRLMLYAALSVATGTPWAPEVHVNEGRSVFISLEDGTATLARRVERWLRGPPKHDAAYQPRDVAKLTALVKKNLKVLGREKATSLVLTQPDYSRAAPRESTVEWLVKHCTGADLVVLETAARLNPCGEDNDTLAVFAGALERVATRTGASVVLVRHVSKESTAKGLASSYAGRGGGSLADAARSVLSVTRDPDKTTDTDPVRVSHQKATHTKRGSDLMWRPVPGDGDVFLQAMRAEERTESNDQALLNKIVCAGPAGITQRDLTHNIKGDAKKAAALAQLKRLLDARRIVDVTPPSKRGPKGPVYVAAVHVTAPANEAEVVPINEGKAHRRKSAEAR